MHSRITGNMNSLDSQLPRSRRKLKKQGKPDNNNALDRDQSLRKFGLDLVGLKLIFSLLAFV